MFIIQNANYFAHAIKFDAFKNTCESTVSQLR